MLNRSFVALAAPFVFACGTTSEEPSVGTSAGAAGGGTTTVVDYEDFSDGASYGVRWFEMSEFLSVGDPAMVSGRNFTGGRLNIGGTFSRSFDLSYDHMKYFSGSTRSFDIPAAGAVTVSADIVATTPGAMVGRIQPVTGRRLMEGQQSAATLSLIDGDDTGLHLAWWVSEHKAFALYERVSPDGRCNDAVNFTQIIGETNVSAGSHNYSIEYRRTNGQDSVRWFIDGQQKNTINRIGIPLDVQQPSAASRITYPSRGPGEELRGRLTNFIVGHGVGTMMDEFPFNQCPTGQVSIPANQRIFGQGISASFDNIRVTTQRPN